MAKKSLLNRIFDVNKTKNRAAFSDVENKITKYHYGSDAFMQILESRYSCHSFSSYPVQESKLQMILEAGRLAPSAGNNQPTRIWVVKSEEALARLHTVHPCYGAPVVLVVGCRNEEAWVRESDGVNAADPRKVREALPETQGHGIYALLAIGHPAEGAGNPTELHSERKPLDQIVKTL